MQRHLWATLCAAAALCLAGFTGSGRSWAGDMSGMSMDSSAPPATQPTTQPFEAVDLRNTVCPVSGDKVEDSKLVEIYDGKVYHLCCPDCHKDFEKDPAKYAAAVAANPAKYGIK